jgi:hypothetical protein
MTPAATALTITGLGAAAGAGIGVLTDQKHVARDAAIGAVGGALLGGLVILVGRAFAAAGSNTSFFGTRTTLGPRGQPLPSEELAIGYSAGLLPETRPSCLECITKHLGAAMVQMAEVRDGYDYEMRIIGHLHEAEDESQAWPEIHDAIRDARKKYYATHQPPDWAKLAAMVSSARATGG